MHHTTQKVLLSDMILCLSKIMEWMSPSIVAHQMRVAYIANALTGELGLSSEHQNELTLAGVLHDIGSFSLKEETRQSDYETEPHLVMKHSELGYLLIRDFRPFRKVAELIRHHHTPWGNGRAKELQGDRNFHPAQIIYLAGKIDGLINWNEEILGQVPDICNYIRNGSGELFVPSYVDAFLAVAEREYFWFTLESATISQAVVSDLRFVNIELDYDNMVNLSKVFSHLIDFRCRYTATHSSGVAGTAEALARLYRFSESGVQMIKVAGYLHDIGKLTIPQEILHKPEHLTPEEFNRVKRHPFWTYQALSNIRGMDEINMWASFHHERIDSQGYPFHYNGGELPLGSRIIAVADVFTALLEDRPYRPGMTRKNAHAILQEMAESRALDAGVVASLMSNIDQIDECRMTAQADSASLYAEFNRASKVNSTGYLYAV